MRKILYRALVLQEDLGELTKNLPTAQRDRVEYAYNAARALSQEWEPLAATPEGLVLCATGVITLEDTGRLKFHETT
jgi:hypothetical protein